MWPHEKIAKIYLNLSMETISHERSVKIFDQSDEQRRHLCKSFLSHAFIAVNRLSHATAH